MAFTFSTLFSTPFPKLKSSKPSLLPRKSSVSSSPPLSFDLRTYWTSLISEVESELNTALSIKYPEKLYEAMRYSVFSGGKRAPPIMCIASCELFDAPRAAALPTAAALEMVHAASHVHDDLPCMDAAQIRHGRPTTHTQYGVDVAVLVGDSLFPLGFTHVVSNTPKEVPRENLLMVLKEIARTVGSAGMAAGQYLDLAGAAAGGENEVILVLEKKFGEMAECSAVCGGILAGATHEEQAALRRYGRTMGVLYELVDDMLKESNGRSGKMRSNASVVNTLGIERAMEIVANLRDQAKKDLESFFGDKYGDRVLPLMSFVDYAVERGFVVERGDEMVPGGAMSVSASA